MITSAPKGTRDILPGESRKWQWMEACMRDVCTAFGYREIRIPTFEHTELFLRSVGSTTDIVQKEMYTFEDKGGRSITLKPEGTAGVARAFVEHSLYNETLPLKMYYLYNPTFRYERPQAGRLREHHQFGVEVFGAAGSTMDAEVILLAVSVLRRLGLGTLEVNLNSIGCPSCRPAYHAKLKAYFAQHVDKLCPTCADRLERNPLRILDCKDKGCHALVEGAPRTLDNLCDDCAEHFTSLKKLLDDAGVRYVINPLLVRGLDYYNRTVFEIVSPDIGAQSSVAGGGRYDGLIEEVGGPATAGIGFGMGMERLLMALEAQKLLPTDLEPRPVYVASMGDAARAEAFRLALRLRERGVTAECDHLNRSFKAQFKHADKLSSRFAVVLGDNELASGMWKVKDLTNGTESTVPKDDIVETLIHQKQGEA